MGESDEKERLGPCFESLHCSGSCDNQTFQNIQAKRCIEMNRSAMSFMMRNLVGRMSSIAATILTGYSFISRGSEMYTIIYIYIHEYMA